VPHKDPEARRAYQREYQRRWAKENREKRVIYEKNWRDANPEAAAEKKRRYTERNREKVNARNTLRRSIAAGKIQREPCDVCGDPQSEGHHHDYSKPLDVRWLCRKHHGELHHDTEG
jgi:hypothetical protein